MKNNILAYAGVALLIGVAGTYILIKSMEEGKTELTDTLGRYGNGLGQTQNTEPNRGNCLTDDCLLVEDLEYPVEKLPTDIKEALDEAINDEYKALSTYEAVMDKFGTVRPFSMIKGAEEQHIASLKAIYDKYGLTVSENEWKDKITAPASLQEACQVGVDAEIANAKLYKDELIPKVKDYEDITGVFVSLMNASEEKHLSAFEKCN